MTSHAYATKDNAFVARCSQSKDVGKGHSKQSARKSFTHLSQAKIRSSNRARRRPWLVLNGNNFVPVDPRGPVPINYRHIRHVTNRGLRNRNKALEQAFCIGDEQLLSSNLKNEQEFRKEKRELSRPKSKESYDEMTPEVLDAAVMIFGDGKQLEYPNSPLDSVSIQEANSMAEKKSSLCSEGTSPPNETRLEESQWHDTEMTLCQAKMSTRVPAWVYCLSGAKGPISTVIHEHCPGHLPACENEATPCSLTNELFDKTRTGSRTALELLTIATEYHQHLTSQTLLAATHQTPSSVGDHADCVVADVPATKPNVPVSPSSLSSSPKRSAELRWLMSKALPMPPPLALGPGIRFAPARRSP